MHFAAWLSVGDSVRNPAGYYRNNVAGAMSVLDAMIPRNVHYLVFSSTAAVFGNRVETPITESHPKLGWTPRFEDKDVIVETAWRWREAHPKGYRKATA